MKRAIASVLLAVLLAGLALGGYVIYQAYKSHVAKSWNVTIIAEKHSIVNHEIIYQITNLENKTRRFKPSILFRDTNFDFKMIRNVRIYIANETYEKVPIYKIVNETECEFDETVNNTICYTVHKRKLIGYKYEKKIDWVPLSYDIKSRKKFGKGWIKHLFKSLEFGPNETKLIKITWQTPVIKTKKGWGSKGYIALFEENSGTNLDPWWDYSWAYRIPITIQEQSGNTLTNYPILIKVDTATLISQGKMKSDCSDIRFTWLNTTSNQEQEIYYWIVPRTCNTANTRIWINVPEIPANGQATVYMYYGNPSAIAPGYTFSQAIGNLFKWWTGYLDEAGTRVGYATQSSFGVRLGDKIFILYLGGGGGDDLSTKYTSSTPPSWSARITIDADVVGTYYGDYAMVSDGSRIVVFYHDSADDLAYKYTDDYGTTWSTKTVIKAGTIPFVTANSLGSTAYVVYTDYAANYYVYGRTFDISTLTVGAEVQITSFRAYGSPQILIDPVTGWVYILFSWYDTATSTWNNVYCLKTKDFSTFYDCYGNAVTLPIGTSTAVLHTVSGARIFGTTIDDWGRLYITLGNGDLIVFDPSTGTKTVKTGALSVADGGLSGKILWIKAWGPELYGIAVLWDGSTQTTKDLYIWRSTDQGSTWGIVARVNIADGIRDDAVRMSIVYDEKLWWYGFYVRGYTGAYDGTANNDVQDADYLLLHRGNVVLPEPTVVLGTEEVGQVTLDVTTHTEDINGNVKTSFGLTEDIVIEANVTHNVDPTYIDTVWVEIYDPSGALYINATMTQVATLGNGYIYQYTFNPPDDNAYVGTWTYTVHANETLRGIHNYTSSSFDVYDDIPPSVTSLTVSDTLLTEADAGGTFTITIDYSEDMDTTIAPTISFNPATNALTSCSGSWYNSTRYQYSCSIVDSDEEISGIDITVSGAQDLAGNVQNSYTKLDAFDVDMQGPSITFNPNSQTWTNQDVSVTISASDGFGVSTLYYAIVSYSSACPAQGSTSYTSVAASSTTVTISSEGEWKICAYATDVSGNTGPTYASGAYQIDKTAPTTSSTIYGTLGDNGWYVSDVNITLTCSDNLSGCSSTEYCVSSTSCTPNTAYTGGNITLSNEGTWYVCYNSTDVAGNVETTNCITVKIDKTYPTTSTSYQGTLGNNGWYISNVNVTLTCSDATSGCNITYYCYDTVQCTPNQVYTGTFTISSENIWYVCYYSVDNAGNQEPTTCDQVKIDYTPPTTSISLSGNQTNGFYTTDVQVTLTCLDNLSGCDTTLYCVDSVECTPNTVYSTSFYVTTEGTNYVCYQSNDTAGNLENKSCEIIKIDKTPPVTTASYSGTLGTNGWYVSNVTATLTCSDNYSGCNQTLYCLSSGTCIPDTQYSGPITITEGIWNLCYRSEDLAGWWETTKCDEIKVDYTPPVTTYTLNETTGNITLTATDNLSGVNKTLYCIDTTTCEPNITYTNEFEAPQGDYYLCFYSIDNANNTETTKCYNIQYDSIPPNTTITLEGLIDNDTGYYYTDVIITLTCSDVGLGCNYTEYCVSSEICNPYILYQNKFAVTQPGDWYVCYRSVDNYGNVEDTKCTNFTISKPIKVIDPLSVTYDRDTDTLTIVATTYISNGTAIYEIYDENENLLLNGTMQVLKDNVYYANVNVSSLPDGKYIASAVISSDSDSVRLAASFEIDRNVTVGGNVNNILERMNINMVEVLSIGLTIIIIILFVLARYKVIPSVIIKFGKKLKVNVVELFLAGALIVMFFVNVGLIYYTETQYLGTTMTKSLVLYLTAGIAITLVILVAYKILEALWSPIEKVFKYPLK